MGELLYERAGKWQKYISELILQPEDKISVLAIDKLGNRNLKKLEFLWDSTAPECELKVLSAISTYRQSAECIDFKNGALELRLTAKDDFDKAPLIFTALGQATNFSLYRETLKVTNETQLYYYATDDAGNAGEVNSIRLVPREKFPVISAP
jgi:hypothetical protein